MSDYPEAFEWVDATVRIKIQKAGHRDPFPTGTAVQFAYDVPHFYIFDELDHPDAWKMMNERDPKHCTVVTASDVALVVGHKFHAAQDEVWRAAGNLKGGSYTAPPMMHDAFMHMWYNIALPSGLFWARYNWLKKYHP